MGINVGGVTYTSNGSNLVAANSSTSIFTIDSTGHFVKHVQPHFAAALVGQGSSYISESVTFGRIIGNSAGSATPWNNTTGVFTCPTYGKYIVCANIIGVAGRGYLGIKFNGYIADFTHWEMTAGSYVPVQVNATIWASPGDTFGFSISGAADFGGSLVGAYGNDSHSYFSIALMK